MNSSPAEGKWTSPPSVIRSLLREAARDPDSYECRPLSVEAHESSVVEVRHKLGSRGTRPFRAVAKLYKDCATSRIANDAEVLRALREQGVKVPAVLGTAPGQNGILLEWFGSRTLADMLKAEETTDRNMWDQAIEELAHLHRALNQLWGGRADIPRWAFSEEQRRTWAVAGLDAWLSWPPAGSDKGDLTRLRLSVDDLADRLVKPESEGDVIWGDCNPKNILVHKGDIRFIDFQLKRSSRMMDLLLLVAFADSPETYLVREEAHQLLGHYWRRVPIGQSLDDCLRTYDDELLWRILVYGGMLLRKREQRLACWQGVCSKMAGDLRELAHEQLSRS